MPGNDFAGQVAIVTGAGNGLGRGCALALAEYGASVVVNDLGGDVDGTGGGSAAADSVVAEIQAMGGKALASYESVASPEGGAAIVRAALEAFGRLDALAHYAGIGRHSRFEDMTIGDFDAVLDVHLRGLFFVAQPAFRQMKEQKYGRILVVGSSAGLFGLPEELNYATAKGGMYGVMRTLALEGEDAGILVNYLMPGAETRLALRSPMHTDEGAAAMREKVGEEATRPEFGAALAAYLLSSRATVSGQAFSSALGRFARVFVGVTPGWQARKEGRRPTIDDVEAHWDQIVAGETYVVPRSPMDEVVAIFEG